LQLFVAASPGNIPRLNEVTLDGTALGFTLGISALTGVLFGWRLPGSSRAPT